MGVYRASKVRGAGRESWSIIFRHPVRKDPSGKTGLRVRRGLGTSVEEEAQRYVAQMNELLSDESLWDLSARETALTRYDPKIVAAFYDAMDSKQVNYQELRDSEMPLPSADEGYAKVLLVGTTGAGKTTLLRQLIGTDPKKDRFPSTSPNKTTVSDMEVICSEGDYRAVVTFFDMREIRLHVEDCVMAAILAKVKEFDEQTVALRLLEHSEQRFRFFYVLGNYETNLDQLEEEEEEFEEEVSENGKGSDYVSLEERIQNNVVIKGLLDQVNNLAQLNVKVKEKLCKELGIEPSALSVKDMVAFEELLDEEIRRSKDFYNLVDEMLEHMVKRFAGLEKGDFDEGNDGWPGIWRFQTGDRDEFIETVRRFSSNYAPYFGKLVTPLVQGIRIKGPFKPDWCESIPKLVFIDGQGVGHTANTTSSLPTQTSRKFESSDVVILVDSSKHPMQAASLSVLRSMAAGGHISKIRICFTHLDGLRGDNLPTRKSRINHVAASLNQAIAHIRSTLGAEVAGPLDKVFADQSYYLANIDRTLGERDHHTISQLKDLMRVLETSIFVETVSEAIPYYDETPLIFAIQHANERFHDIWESRLGDSMMAGEPKRHWTQIKALSRRLAYVFDDGEYAQMRPVAELQEQLMNQIRLFLNKPARWVVPGNVTDKEKAEAIDRIARGIHSHLLDFAAKRVWHDRLTPWNRAYELRGEGSAGKRGEAFKSIFNDASPKLEGITSEQSYQFLLELRHLVRDAITSKGGRILTTIEEVKRR